MIHNRLPDPGYKGAGVFYGGQFVRPRRRRIYSVYVKRGLDIGLTLLGAIVILPLALIAMLLVSLDGHKPLYVQTRIGRNGRRFRIYKIRTMVPNAEALLQERLQQDPELAAEWNSTQKLRSDFRITPIGHLLRKSSLDELPQFWNVLNGTMSLVGPRPMMPDQQDLYPGRAYYMLRPGITGLWQVSKRNDSTFADRAIFDDHYARLISFGTDLRVMFQTLGVIVRATGH